LFVDKQSWFVLQVSHQHEFAVASALEYKGYQAFVPTYLSRRLWADRTKLIERPLFAGYVFCRILETSVGRLLTIPGVNRIVGFKGKPSVVSEEEIQAIHRIIESRMEVRPYGPALAMGERVQVKTGPLAGISGILVDIRNRSHLVVSVDITMKAISVDLGTCEVVALRVA
jgi:transcription termination/antitermination protein NusG